MKKAFSVKGKDEIRQWMNFGLDYCLNQCILNDKVPDLFKYMVSKSGIIEKNSVNNFQILLVKTLKSIDRKNKLGDTLGSCGKRWNYGTPAFKCKTCETDPTCAICEECFTNGDHKGHEYSMTTFSSGVCDCGDPDAWKKSGFCKNHKGPGEDPLSHIPQPVLSVVSSIIEVLVSELFSHLLDPKKRVKKEQLRVEQPRLQLRNNNLLMQRIRRHLRENDPNNPNITELNNLMTFIRQINPQLENINPLVPPNEPNNSNSNTSNLATNVNEIRQVEMAEPNMSPLIKLLEELVGSYPCIKRIYHNTLVKHDRLKKLLQSHLKFSNSNRKQLSKFYNAIISDTAFKRNFSCIFATIYQKYFLGIMGKRRGKFHLTSITVQFFTVPSIIQTLHEKYDFFFVLLETLTKVFEKHQRKLFERSVLDCTKKDEVFQHTIYDLRYLFNHEYSAKLLLLNQKLFKQFIKSLEMIQFSNVVQKIDNDSNAWRYAFGNEFLHFPKLFRIIMAKAMPVIKGDELNMLMSNVKYLIDVIYETHGQIKKIYDVKKLNVDGPVSFHIPLHKFLGYILHYMLRFNPKLSFQSLFNDIHKDKLYTCLLYPLKIITSISHVRRRFWPRDNMGILSQVLSYCTMDHYKDYSYLMDYFLIQIFSQFLPKERFINDVVKHFLVKERIFPIHYQERVSKEMDVEFDAIKFFMILYFDRSFSGSTYEDTSKKCILHELFCGDKEYTKLFESLPRTFRKSVKIEKFIKEIAIFKTSKGLNSSSQYIIKKDMWNLYNPYFALYTLIQYETSSSRNELKKDDSFFLPYIERHKVNSKENFLCMNDFNALFRSQIYHKIIFSTLHQILQYVQREKITSDQLLRTTLYFLYILLLDCDISQFQEEVFAQKDIDGDVIMKEQEITKEKPRFFDDVKYSFGDNVILNVHEEVSDTNHSILSLLYELKGRKIMLKLMNKIIEKYINVTKEINCLLKDNSKAKLHVQNILKTVVQYEEGEREKNHELKRKKKAKKHRERILRKMKKKKKQFDFKVDEMDLNEPKESTDNENEERCCFCHQQSSSSPLVYFCHLSKTKSLKVVEERALKIIGIHNRFLCHCDLIPMNFPHYNDLYSNISIQSGLQINHCSHQCHSKCFHNYWKGLFNQSRSGFKGRDVLILGNTEIMCPICSRIENSLLPIVKESFKELILKEEKISKASASLNVNTQINTSEFSLQQSRNAFFNKMENLAFGIPDSPQSSPLLFVNAFAYNVSTVETSIRGKSLRTIKPRRMELLKVIAKNSLFMIKNEFSMVSKIISLNKCLTGQKCNSITKFEFPKNYSAIENLKINKILKDDNDIDMDASASKKNNIDVNHMAFLSCDMFSFFIRYIFLNNKYIESEKKIKGIINDCLIGAFIQVILNCHLKFTVKDNKSLGNPIVSNVLKSIKNVEEKLMFQREKLKYFEVEKNIINDVTKFIEVSLLSFLRRIVIVKSILFNIELPREENENEFSYLINYMKLDFSESILNNRKGIIEKWLYQYYDNLKTHELSENTDMKNKAIVDFFIPLPSSPMQFQFCSLPKVYESLFLKCRFYKCKTCAKQLKNPMLDLLDGELTYAKRCNECDVDYVAGNLTRRCVKKYEGKGIFINVKRSSILIYNDGRKAFLPSPYRNKHGEEDIGLSSGVSLYLDEEYLKELIPMFILNEFDQDSKVISRSSNFSVSNL